MPCIGPATPDDFELLAYADELTSVEIVNHLSACPTCRARANALVREQLMLQALLYRTGCPRSLELGEFRLGLLTEERASEVSAHLPYCPTCRAELAALDAFVADLARSSDCGGVIDGVGMLRTVHARLSSLTLDRGAGMLAPALRGDAPSAGDAPLVYDAEHVLVTLKNRSERLGRNTRQIVGSIAGASDFAGVTARIEIGKAITSIASVDDLGAFSLPGIPPGKHRLVIQLPSDGIELRIDDLIVC